MESSVETLQKNMFSSQLYYWDEKQNCIWCVSTVFNEHNVFSVLSMISYWFPWCLDLTSNKIITKGPAWGFLNHCLPFLSLEAVGRSEDCEKLSSFPSPTPAPPPCISSSSSPHPSFSWKQETCRINYSGNSKKLCWGYLTETDYYFQLLFILLIKNYHFVYAKSIVIFKWKLKKWSIVNWFGSCRADLIKQKSWYDKNEAMFNFCHVTIIIWIVEEQNHLKHYEKAQHFIMEVKKCIN